MEGDAAGEYGLDTFENLADYVQRGLAEERRLVKMPDKIYRSSASGPDHPIGAPPMFPWPPPLASAQQSLLRSLFSRDSQNSSFADIDDRLTSALDAKGYFEKSYYQVPGGFAVVTRLEQIEADGRSKTVPERWSVDPPRLTNFSLDGYSALFSASSGYYRIIVFIVTNVPFAQSDKRFSQQEASAWLHSGLNELPESIGLLHYPPDIACTVQIYEFMSTGKKDSAPAFTLQPGRLDAHTHLLQSGLSMAFGIF
jgi:hypothetical protein